MSIASEIKRLITAKSNLKTSFQKRNIPIENETIDKYAEKLEFAAVALNGSFVPEQDTRIFQIKGLHFTPTAIQISNNELYDQPLTDALISYSQVKSQSGSVVYGDLTGTSATANPVAASSFAIHWESDGFTIEIPYSVGVVFKAGYVYKWIITGDSQYNNLLSADNPIYTIISNEEYDSAINEKTLYREQSYSRTLNLNTLF